MHSLGYLRKCGRCSLGNKKCCDGTGSSYPALSSSLVPSSLPGRRFSGALFKAIQRDFPKLRPLCERFQLSLATTYMQLPQSRTDRGCCCRVPPPPLPPRSRYYSIDLDEHKAPGITIPISTVLAASNYPTASLAHTVVQRSPPTFLLLFRNHETFIIQQQEEKNSETSWS